MFDLHKVILRITLQKVITFITLTFFLSLPVIWAVLRIYFLFIVHIFVPFFGKYWYILLTFHRKWVIICIYKVYMWLSGRRMFSCNSCCYKSYNVYVFCTCIKTDIIHFLLSYMGNDIWKWHILLRLSLYVCCYGNCYDVYYIWRTCIIMQCSGSVGK